MAQALEHESGLTGLAGSADMRAVLAAPAAATAPARLAHRRLPAPPASRSQR